MSVSSVPTDGQSKSIADTFVQSILLRRWASSTRVQLEPKDTTMATIKTNYLMPKGLEPDLEQTCDSAFSATSRMAWLERQVTKRRSRKASAWALSPRPS